MAQYYEAVLNPFGVQDKSQLTLADFDEADPFYEAVRFCFDNGLMQAASDEAFGTDLPATLGEFAQVMVAILGGAYTQEDSIAFLAQYGIVPMADAATELSVADLDGLSCNFIAAAWGVELGEFITPDLAEMGIAADAPATRAYLAYAVFGMIGE